MTHIFGKLVVFCTLVMHPALSAVNARQHPEQHNLRDVCQMRKISALDVRCYFVVLLIFCCRKYFHQIKHKVRVESQITS